MKTYTLQQNERHLHLSLDGQELSLTDFLCTYPQYRVFCFHGQMGAGKTTFVKQLCEEMGVEDIVNSPTFAIVNVYGLPATSPFAAAMPSPEVYHFDCYRLKNIQEALDLGAEEYLYAGNYCFVEWPEMIEAILPDDALHLTFQVVDEHTRIFTVE